VAGVLVVLAAVVWIARGSKKAGGAVPPKESTETRKQNEPDAGSAAEKKATEPGAAAQGEKKGLEPAHKGMGFLAAETGDIREDSARRELAKLVEMEQSGKGSAGELRQRYESLVASRGATAAGQEAARRLKALPRTRPPSPNLACTRQCTRRPGTCACRRSVSAR
jgi:hypothetical protein